MARRLFTLATAVSMLLCAAIWVLWVRSYRVTDQAQVTGRGWRVGTTVSDGRVAVHIARW